MKKDKGKEDEIENSLAQSLHTMSKLIVKQEKTMISMKKI